MKNNTYIFRTDEFEQMCKNPESHTKKQWKDYLVVFAHLEVEYMKECFKKYFPKYYDKHDDTILSFLFARDYDMYDKFTKPTDQMRKLELLEDLL